MSTRPTDLQITEDVGFQIRMSRFQRIGRWFCSLLLAGGLAGLAGGGPLSRAVAAKGSVQLRFDRFARMTSPQSFDLHLLSSTPATFYEVGMDTALLKRIQVESILPQPFEQTSSASGIRFKIRCEGPNQAATVVIRYRPLTAGWLRGRLEVGTAGVSFGQFVYP